MNNCSISFNHWYISKITNTKLLINIILKIQITKNINCIVSINNYLILNYLWLSKIYQKIIIIFINNYFKKIAVQIYWVQYNYELYLLKIILSINEIKNEFYFRKIWISCLYAYFSLFKFKFEIFWLNWDFHKILFVQTQILIFLK